MDFYIANVGSKVRENEDFFVSRPNGHPRYIFIQFLTEALMIIHKKEINIKPGMVIIYTPDFNEFYKPVGGPLCHDWIEFKVNDKSIFEMLKIPLNEPFITTDSQSISKIIHEMKKTFDENMYYSQIELDKEMIELLLLISKNLNAKYANILKKKESGLRGIYEDIRLRIYQNPIHKTIASIAKEAGYSQSYFCATYKKLFNVTALDDLNESKKLYVEYAIKNNKKTIDIINDLGFTSLEYFYMWFKKQFNMTVKEYRTLIKKSE